MNLHLDFETRSEVDLKACGAYKYAIDSSTDILCTAWCVDAGPVTCEIGPEFLKGEPLCQLRAFAGDPNALFYAFNAQFERYIWENILVKRYGFPSIPLNRWRCVAVLSRYYALPSSLADVADALEAPHRKNEKLKRTMMKMCKPTSDGEWHEEPEDFEKLMEYCKDDVETERAIHGIIGDVPPEVQSLWELDRRINERGLLIDEDFVDAALSLKKPIMDRLNDAMQALIGCDCSQIEVILGWVQAQGVRMSSLDARTLKPRLDAGKLPAAVAQVARLRLEYSFASLAKLKAAKDLMVDGVVRDQFFAYGATTHRWSSKGIQLQNLPRGGYQSDEARRLGVAMVKARDLSAASCLLDMSEMDVLKSSLRGMVIPRPGNDLYVLDFAQIEARVLAWLAGQEDMLQSFRDDLDLYKFAAAQIFKVSYAQVTKDQRNIGKVASLALGYQGGASAFATMALNYGLTVDTERANEIKTQWREKNYRIVTLWSSLQKAAIQTVTTGRPTRVHGKITFRMESQGLSMQLPSGSKLWYYKPTVRMELKDIPGYEPFESLTLFHMGSDSKRHIKWGEISTYGGKLTENAVQSIAWDLLVNALANAEASGFEVIGHVHDEIIAERPRDNHTHIGDNKLFQEKEDGNIRSALLNLREEVCKLPPWVGGIPFGTKEYTGDRYKKD